MKKKSVYALNTSLIKVTPAETEDYNKRRTLLLRKQTKRFGQVHLSFEEQTSKLVRVAVAIEYLLQSRTWHLFIMGITIFALFGDDLRIAIFPKSADVLFDILSIFSLLVFVFELLATSFVNRTGYLGSFYFYLDLLAIFSMITDITFLWNNIIFAGQATSPTNTEQIENLQNTLQGSKSSRIIRIVRIVRLVRVAKLFGLTQKQNDEDYTDVKTKPSIVGLKLADRTMKRVITMVLVMLLSVPFFEPDFYQSSIEDEGLFIGLQTLHRSAQDLNISNDLFSAKIQSYVRASKSLLRLDICPSTAGCLRYNLEPGGKPQLSVEEGIHNIWPSETIAEIAKETRFYDTELSTWLTIDEDSGYFPSLTLQKYQNLENLEVDFRFTELAILSTFECYGPNHIQLIKGYEEKPCTAIAYFDQRNIASREAWLNITRTIFIGFVLLFGYIFHNVDAHELVITPIERMVASLQNFAANPMKNLDFGNKTKQKMNKNEEDETVLLQDALTRVGRLLQISFGAAGSRIIAKNMQQAAQGNEIDPMVDGQRMTAVFGFCDIRNFTDTTECLQEKVMVYVNRVGQIVHRATHLFGGAANKNIGDAFLLVWRLEETAPQTHQRNICDSALLAFIKVMIDLKRENEPNGVLYSYTKHPTIKQRFGDDFKIKLGIGLHIGWAIEGAIGSQYKIDASYLSPNVNLAARLEAATKQFGTDILLSSEFYNMLSYGGKRMCRIIDKVTVKGSIRPMGIYTLDITNYPTYFPSKSNENRLVDENNLNFESNEVKGLQRDLNEDFTTIFAAGMKSYFEGNWSMAKENINQALKYYPDDGPSLNLLAYMSTFNFEAPEKWEGVRILTEK